MKQKDLAKELDVSEAYISQVLSGKKKPSMKMVKKLTNLGIPLYDGEPCGGRTHDTLIKSQVLYL